jgi:hypothetical protein
VGKNGEVGRYLKNFGPQMHFDASLQIISQEEFDRVQRIHTERAKLPPRSANTEMPFSIILKCPYCSGPMGGNNRYRGKNEIKFLQHMYRCRIHFEDHSVCRTGYRIACIPVASAVLPFVVDLLQVKLTDMLDRVSHEYSIESNYERLQAETWADLGKVNQNIKRIADSIANGVLFPFARSKTFAFQANSFSTGSGVILPL